MASTEQDDAYLMDLTVLLKALRETRQEAAQVVQQLREQVQACRDLDARAATTLSQAVQRATTALQQEQARTVEHVGAEAPAPAREPPPALAAGSRPGRAGPAMAAVEGGAAAPRGHAPGARWRRRVVGVAARDRAPRAAAGPVLRDGSRSVSARDALHAALGPAEAGD